MKSNINPLAKFINEHTNLLINLKKLNDIIFRIEKNGFTPKLHKSVEDLLKILEEEINDHNLLEETALFPILRKYVRKPPEFLVKEHKEMKQSYLNSIHTLSQINRYNDKIKIDQLTKHLKYTIQIFVNHIYKENYILFPLMKKFFTKQDFIKITKRMNT